MKQELLFSSNYKAYYHDPSTPRRKKFDKGDFTLKTRQNVSGGEILDLYLRKSRQENHMTSATSSFSPKVLFSKCLQSTINTKPTFFKAPFL